jgi:DNA-binding protein HU-alpha
MSLEPTLVAITESLKEYDTVQLVGFSTFKVNIVASVRPAATTKLGKKSK